MVSAPRLAPFVREKREPRMSATALAEYMILTADGQENILHDCRYQRAPMVAANADAMRALRSYNSDARRDRDALDAVKAALKAKSDDKEIKPKARDEARRCAEAIDLFQKNENALGMRGLALSVPPTFDTLDIAGVAVSIKPDFLVTGGGGSRVGAAMIRVAKSPDPAGCKLDETRQRRGDHRRELGRYMIALMQMLLDAQGDGLGAVDRDLFFVADVRLGERIVSARDHTSRMRAIEGACRQIATLWDDIAPKPSILARPGDYT